MRQDGRFCNRPSEKTVQGEIKQDRTVRLPSPHGFLDVKGRCKQKDDGQTADIPKKKASWAGKRKVQIKERAVLDN